MHRIHVILLTAVAAAVASCRDVPADGGSAIALQLEESLRTSTVGTGDGPGLLSRVVSARLTPDGSRVAVLDNAPPFLKVYSRDGRLERAFIERGGGPTELEGAASVAVTDAMAVLVGRGTLVSVLLTGDTLHRHRKPFQITDVAYRCASKLTAYGPARTGDADFIHLLEQDPGVRVLGSTFRRPRPEFPGWSKAIIGSAGGAVVAHRTGRGGPVELAYVDCAGRLAPRAWAWAVDAFPSQSANPILNETRTGDRIQTTVSPAVPVFAGAGEIDGKLLWVENRMSPSKGSGLYADQTDLYLVDDSTVRITHVAGRFRLEDVAAGYVLLSTSDPWPRVAIVHESQLLGSLGHGEVVSRK